MKWVDILKNKVIGQKEWIKFILQAWEKFIGLRCPEFANLKIKGEGGVEGAENKQISLIFPKEIICFVLHNCWVLKGNHECTLQKAKFIASLYDGKKYMVMSPGMGRVSVKMSS